ncbi:MAG: RHS repeat-associated core domain-containing protein [Microscillaceae bacterium]|nr:RHS repeat-associated core domain-containing protein [Microscillaceae bacterium]
MTQENHYYPFGLNIVSLEKQGDPNHKFQYNGKEKQEEFGLNWLDYGARMYDAQLGRWHAVDPESELYEKSTPYNYALNNPINAIDPNGEEVYFLNGQDAARVLADLNIIFRQIYDLDYDVFSLEEKKVTGTKTRDIEKDVEFNLFDWDTWDGKKTEKVKEKVEITKYSLKTNSDFDWNKDKYASAVFDLVNTDMKFEVSLESGSMKTELGTLKDQKGRTTKGVNSGKIMIDEGLKPITVYDVSLLSSKWTVGGTFLHEGVAHLHYLGGEEDNVGLQQHFKIPRSTTKHNGEPKTIWTPKERERLRQERAKTGQKKK